MNHLALLLVALPLLSSPPAQESPLRSVDLYGLRTVDEQTVRAALGIAAGDSGAVDERALEERLRSIEGVADAHVAKITVNGGLVMFAGVREDGVPAVVRRPAPTGEVLLAPEIRAAHDEMMQQFAQAVAEGIFGEDISQGHSLIDHEPTRSRQLEFVELAEHGRDVLLEVLYESRAAPHRAMAATILAYSHDKAGIVEHLAYAAGDPDDTVRNNAVRALGLIAKYGQDHPELGIDVDPAPFFALIESLVWTDRNKGAAALSALTEARDGALFARLRGSHLPALVEMARWKSRGHAHFSILILGRLAGLTDAEIEASLRTQGADWSARVAWIDEVARKATGDATLERER